MNYIDEILNGSIYENKIIQLFYMLPVSRSEIQNYSKKDLETASSRMLDYIYNTRTEDIVNIIEANKEKIGAINPANIPQFSNIDAINGVLDIVESSDDIDFELIGYYLNKAATTGAQVKYGENHYKTAALMGLTTINKPFEITALGKAYKGLDTEKKINVRNKLFLLIPIIQTIIIDAKYKEIAPMDVLKKYLSESTAVRRRSNVRTMVEYVYNSGDVEFTIEIQKNLNWK